VLIDWFTILAQAANFLILIAILKRFLYGPIMKAMDTRERKIADRLQQAEQARLQAAALSKELEQEKENLQATRQKYFEKAKTEVLSWRDNAMQEARQETEQLRQTWKENIIGEQESFKRLLKQHIGQQVFHAAEKVLLELADAGLEARLTESFLQTLEKDPTAFFRDGAKKPTSIKFRSGFEIDATLRDRVRNVIKDTFSATTAVDFSIKSDLGFGLQLVVGDRKVDWNMNRYLQEMEDEVLRVFKFSSKTIS
jgi:F-type H+-transporting ATPase subunit b